ncbi:MAG: TonB-dependent receptor [Nonlabens sp.]
MNFNLYFIFSLLGLAFTSTALSNHAKAQTPQNLNNLNNSSSQTELQIIVLDSSDNEPILGANLYFPELKKGTTTDVNGRANFDSMQAGIYSLQISYVGYATVTQNVEVPRDGILTIRLNPSEDALDEIVIQSTRSTRTFKRTPTRVEFIGGEELVEKTAMNSSNIAMILRESTGIQMQQTSQSSANQTIRIQGLDGRYTQLLKDGFPLYGGFSGGLSVMQIPPLDIAQFELIKGSASTLYGGGAIAGLVNMQTKRPRNEAALDIMLVGTQALGTTGNIFYSKRNDKWGTTLYASGNLQQAYDPDGDEFSNLPQTETISFNPRVFYYPSKRTTLWLGLNGTYDNRTGGFLDIIDGDANGYTEQNVSRRFSSQADFRTKLNENETLEIKNSINYFNRDLIISDYNFEGAQINSFTEASYNASDERTDWILGANLYTRNFDEDAGVDERDQSDTTVGAFVNNVYDFSDRFILETGFRTDYAADWGVFALPRFSLLYKSKGTFTSRLGGGLGYKIPDLFTEDAERVNFQNVLAINKDQLDAETSHGLNLDFDYKFRVTDEIKGSINQLFYLTAIEDGLILNSNGSGFLEYDNASDLTLSRGAETNLKFSYKDFKWFLNYAFIDTQLNYIDGNPEIPLTAKHSAGSIFMYETSKWRLGLETYYWGEQLLFNGTETDDYVLMGILAMRNFDWGHVFVNFENLTNQRQDQFSPTVQGTATNPVFNELYAPNDGFIFSLGVIWKPFGNHDEHHDED